MNFNYNEKLESRNFVDNVNFSKDDPCIWNVYPAGASGDLLASIINCHYGNTGSNYYGINNNGQVIFRPTDCKITNNRQESNSPLFDEQHFYDIAESLGQRNLNYSLLDQVIFSCHMYRNTNIKQILSNFPKSKIIRTYVIDSHGNTLVEFLRSLKNKNNITTVDLSLLSTNTTNQVNLLDHPMVLNIPFGALFNEESYYDWYDQIIKFLNLNGRLICFDYVKYYLSKQHRSIQHLLIEYSKTL